MDPHGRQGINGNKFHDLAGKGHERVAGDWLLVAGVPGEREGTIGEREREILFIDPRNEFKPRVKRPDCRTDCIWCGIMKILLASSAPEDSLTAY